MKKDNLKGWIPVSKMLPKAGGHYLVTYDGNYAKSIPLVKESKFLNGKFDVENVIAWQELPLPYLGN